MTTREQVAVRTCRGVPVLQTADYSDMARGSPPVRGPQGMCYQQLDNDIWTFCSRLHRGGRRERKKATCLVITDVLTLAVLSEDVLLCHYCAPALIIDSIKMAVKLDVPISSGACCLF